MNIKINYEGNYESVDEFYDDIYNYYDGKDIFKKFIDDNMKVEEEFIPFIVKVKREDGEKSTTIIKMPESFKNVDEYDDKFDDLLWEKIEDNIFFEGLGYEIMKIEPFFKE